MLKADDDYVLTREAAQQKAPDPQLPQYPNTLGFYPALGSGKPTWKEISSGMDEMIAFMGKVNKLYGTCKQMAPFFKWVTGSLLTPPARTASMRRGRRSGKVNMVAKKRRRK